MKKLLTIVLTFVFMLTMYIPAFAAEASAADTTHNPSKVTTQEDVEALVRKYFPEEYARIMSSAPTACTPSADTYVISPATVASIMTKEINKNESISILHLKNGRDAFLYNVDFYTNSTSSGADYTTVDTGIMMTIPTYSGFLTINGFNYTIYDNAYDKINSAGSSLGSTYGVSIRTDKATENSSGPASVTYSMPFDFNFVDGQTVFTLQVSIGNNERTYSVY